MRVKERLVYSLKHYFFNIILIWGAILIYRFSPYYSSFLSSETQKTLLYLGLLYTVIGFFMYIILPLDKIPQSKGHIIYSSTKRVIKDSIFYLKNYSKIPDLKKPKFEKHEKTSFLFLLVKIFFLPLMLNFFYGNYFSVKGQLPKLMSLGVGGLFTMSNFNFLLYPFLISLIFLVDTLYFCFGYSFEAGFLKNKVRSVEPTIFGWVVAIASYPPFNGLVSNYVSWYANDYALFSSNMITFIARILVIILLSIYLSATLALGTRCSNLTNRGIVCKGPYKYVRHPAYIGKNMAWWITLIPVFGVLSILSMLTWSLIYYFRAITEERHLIQDPDYQEYCKKVKYRFIPGVY